MFFLSLYSILLQNKEYYREKLLNQEHETHKEQTVFIGIINNPDSYTVHFILYKSVREYAN